MFRPHLRVATVHELTPALLKEHGLQALLVDVDDTLLAARDELVDPSVYEWFRGMREAGVPVAILSNGSPARVAAIATRAGVPALYMAGKPFWWAFKRGMRLLEGADPARTAMVGDQLFTDVLGARSAGLKSVLVRPLSAGKLPHTRLARRIERMVLKES